MQLTRRIRPREKGCTVPELISCSTRQPPGQRTPDGSLPRRRGTDLTGADALIRREVIRRGRTDSGDEGAGWTEV